MKKNYLASWQKLLSFLILLFYPLCILPKEFFCAISLIILLIILLKFKIKLNYFLYIVVACCLIHIFSSTYFYIISPETEFSRVFSTFNTILSWIIAFLLISCLPKASNLDKASIKKISLFAKINIFIIFVISMLAIICDKINLNIIFLGRSLLIDDWTNGVETHRQILFFEYSSLITFFCIFNLGFIFASEQLNFKNFLFILLSFFPIYFSKSRICIVAYFLLLAFIIFFILKMKLKQNFARFVIFIFLVFFFGFIIFFDQITSIISGFFLSREGSNSLRFSLYIESIKNTFSINPLFGCGIKIMYSENVPMGSHSTFIGTFYKTGIFGFSLLLFFILLLISYLIKKKNLILLGVFASIFLICLFEDIDGTNWLVFYFAGLLYFCDLLKPYRVYKRKQVLIDG